MLGDHVDGEQHIGVDVRQYVHHRVLDLLLHQLGLGLGNAQVVALALSSSSASGLFFSVAR